MPTDITLPTREGHLRGQVICRRLWPSDGPAVQACFLRLDPEGRASRFMASVSDLYALAYAERSLSSEGLVFGAFVDGTLRGVAELRPAGYRCPLMISQPLGARAEAAFAVEQDFRHQGIGTLLFQRLSEAARSRSVVKLELRCLYDNLPMRAFAAKVGARLRGSGIESEGAVRLDRPTPFSLWGEAIAQSYDLSLALAASPPPLEARLPL